MTVNFEINERFQQQIWTATLYNAEIGTSDGEWFDVRGMDLWSIDISGINGETLELYGSNAAIKPADNVDGRQLGLDITQDQIVANVVPVSWAKLKLPTGGAGSVTARFVGITRKS
jgi:hypothetical protein